MKKLVAAAALLATFTAAPALADADRGLTLGLRASYGVPLGTAGDGESLADLTSGAVPVQIDVGYRFTQHWQAGAYFAWGPAMLVHNPVV